MVYSICRVWTYSIGTIAGQSYTAGAFKFATTCAYSLPSHHNTIIAGDAHFGPQAAGSHSVDCLSSHTFRAINW
jgi:hypothetical protein